MGRKKRGDGTGGGRVVTFVPRKAPAKRGGTPPEAPGRHRMNLYLDLLQDHDLISHRERGLIEDALRALAQQIPTIDEAVMEAVRNEYGKDREAMVRDIANAELARWERAPGRYTKHLPGFEMAAAHARFKTQSPEEFARRVRSFDPAHRPEAKIAGPQVPYELHRGERFFLILLRMFRRQHMVDLAMSPPEDFSKDREGSPIRDPDHAQVSGPRDAAEAGPRQAMDQLPLFSSPPPIQPRWGRRLARLLAFLVPSLRNWRKESERLR